MKYRAKRGPAQIPVMSGLHAQIEAYKKASMAGKNKRIKFNSSSYGPHEPEHFAAVNILIDTVIPQRYVLQPLYQLTL